MTPLTGVRVLDLSRLIPGPFATLVLADMGATVDKVEDPGAGDYLRLFPPMIAGNSAAFHALNRGKRSLVLDLKKPEGAAALTKLLASYDVLFEQFRPGVLDRLGLGHDALREKFPKLIVCALTGYGQTGPMAKRAGHDLDYLARAGLLGFQGPEHAPPTVPGFQLADVAGGLWSALAIVGALRERDRTGNGAILDIAMTDGVLGFASAAFGGIFGGEMPKRGAELLTGGIAPYNTYLAKDGAPMALAALEPKFWTAFCLGVGIEVDLQALLPGPHQPAIKARLTGIFLTKTRRDWEIFAELHDCCLEPVLRPDELRDDPHLQARELFFDIVENGVKFPQFRTPVSPKGGSFSPAPKRGEHGDVILAEGGLSPDEIARLRQSGAIG